MLLDPLYGFECTVSKEMPNETYFYRLAGNYGLSYSLHRDLLDRTDIYPLLRKYNDYFHSKNTGNVFAEYCLRLTCCMDNPELFVTLDEAAKELKDKGL